MISSETLRDRQEEKDARIERIVRALKKEWEAYSPYSQIEFIKSYEEVALYVLQLIKEVK